jgi:hypothetical protein
MWTTKKILEYSQMCVKTNKPLVYPDKRFTFYTTKKESTKERNSELYPKPPEGGSEFIPVHAMD